MRNDNETSSSQNRKPGRPRCEVSGAHVKQLRELGLSWRRVAAKLNTSPASAVRALRAYQNSEKACQNPAVPGLNDYPSLWDD